MSFFRGTVTNKIDSKGRVSVPARFRAVIEAEGLGSVYCCKSLMHKALDAGGKRLMDEVDQMLTQFNLYSGERHDLSHALIGASDDLALDREGRISLPEAFREFAGLDGEVTFVGLGNRFEIWDKATLLAHVEESRARARSYLQSIGGDHGGA